MKEEGKVSLPGGSHLPTWDMSSQWSVQMVAKWLLLFFSNETNPCLRKSTIKSEKGGEARRKGRLMDKLLVCFLHPLSLTVCRCNSLPLESPTPTPIRNEPQINRLSVSYELLRQFWGEPLIMIMSNTYSHTNLFCPLAEEGTVAGCVCVMRMIMSHHYHCLWQWTKKKRQVFFLVLCRAIFCNLLLIFFAAVKPSRKIPNRSRIPKKQVFHQK